MRLNRRAALYVLAACLLIALIVVVDAFAIEPYRVRVESVDIPMRDLPAEWDGLRVAQISDLHITTLGRHERDVQAKLAELQPDMIVVTGDLIEHVASYDIWAERAAEVETFLQRLTAPLGVWASRGNTDISRYGGHSAVLAADIRASGAMLLINDHASLERGDAPPIYVAGADYANLGPGFSADHTVQEVAGNKVLAAEACEGNAFAHYLPATWPETRDGEFSGRFQFTDAEGGVGVLFASRQPLGEDNFLRLRRLGDAPEWVLSPKGASISGGTANSDIATQPGVWYRFRTRWETAGDVTQVRARLWPDGQEEPVDWPIDCAVTGVGAGTIGFWSVGPGWKYLDDLEWTGADAADGAWHEDFEGDLVDSDPLHWLDFGINKGNVGEALRGIPLDGLSILLAHSPDAIGEAEAEGADLVLSGHTHGGQVRLPLLGPIDINTDLGRAYNAGLFQFGDSWLYVNRGIGTRAIPVRFLCPPEITLLTLRRQP